MQYTDSHLWIKKGKNTYEIGITEYGNQELDSVVYADMPDSGKRVEIGDELCVLETTKTIYTINSPFKGKIISVCEDIEKLQRDCLNIPLVTAECESFVELYTEEPNKDVL